MTQVDTEGTPEERALAALRQRLARPQPRAAESADGVVPVEEESAGSGSATGFVGMLAKRHLDGEPPAGAAGGIEAESARRHYPLQMAREISPQVAEAPPAPEPVCVSVWYRLAVPAAWVLAGLLTVIGIWAVGALIYMRMRNGESHPPIISPNDVGYPLIVWSYSAGPLGNYTAASRMMAWMMLACLPVAGLLIMMARMIRRRIAGAGSV